MSFLNRWTRDQQRQACISSLIFISWQGAGVCWYHLSLKNNICSTWEYIFYPSPSPPLLMSPEAGHLPAMLLFIALSICTIFLIKMGKKKNQHGISAFSAEEKRASCSCWANLPMFLGWGRGASCPVGTVLPPRDGSTGTLIRGLWSLGLFLFHEEWCAFLAGWVLSWAEMGKFPSCRRAAPEAWHRGHSYTQV